MAILLVVKNKIQDTINLRDQRETLFSLRGIIDKGSKFIWDIIAFNYILKKKEN